MSDTTTTNDPTTTTPLLTPSPSQTLRTRSRAFSRRTALRGAARLLRSNRGMMMSNQSLRVRESAAQHLEDRHSDWAYSTPVVSLDLLWNTIFVCTSIVILSLSSGELSSVPLRLWIVGYCCQCLLHMVCVCSEFKRRRGGRVAAAVGGGGGSSVGGWTGSVGSLTGNENESLVNESSSSSSSASDFVPYVADRREDEDETSVAKHLESANTMFSFIWWIIGFYWVSSGGETLAADAPKLYWLTITFLAFDVFFVVICVAVACVIGIAVCCCLPCIIAILYAVADQEGATREDIERLPKYNFKPLGNFKKENGEIQESFGGIMTECDTDTPIERALSAEDAECCICITKYDEASEIRELPCRHHFHCACVDKWLHTNATCPLCKYNILKNGNQSSEDV